MPSHGTPRRTDPLVLQPVRCCVCDTDDAVPVAVGQDFEYATSPDSFLAMRCRGCGLLYLNPRPAPSEIDRIYPADYHAFNFSPQDFGFVHKVRSRLESRRVLSWCRDLGASARILDVGCGDGFHLKLLREFGQPGWQLEGIDLSSRAVEAATRAGLTVHLGSVQQLDLTPASYDLALLIMTIEHVDDPAGVLTAVRRLLRPGGSVVVVTDNADALDFKLFGGRHWGGYHFPRHYNLFGRRTLRALADKVGLEVASLATAVTPVNWVYSIRNALVDWGAPRWLYEQFSLKAPLTLAAFTVFDTVLQFLGRGGILRAILRRPHESRSPA